MKQSELDGFKNHKIKAKELFNVKPIEKNEAYDFVKQYHYLADARFFSKFQYGIFIKNGKMVRCSTFSNPQGIGALKGWFGLSNQDQSVLELSRLCIHPLLNGTNATSFLLARSIRLLKKEDIRAVITLADSSRHVGSIYQVCNFKYYGLTNKKTDFFTEDGKINPRGSTKDVRGIWLPRTQKHRYAYILDKKLECNYKEESRPTVSDTKEITCCNGTNEVFDKRFDVKYTCPKCTGELKTIE